MAVSAAWKLHQAVAAPVVNEKRQGPQGFVWYCVVLCSFCVVLLIHAYI